MDTKHTAKPDELVRSIETGTLRQVDVHPPFRTLVKHKAFITEWVINNLPDPQFVLTFFAEDISDCVYSLMYASWHFSCEFLSQENLCLRLHFLVQAHYYGRRQA